MFKIICILFSMSILLLDLKAQERPAHFKISTQKISDDIYKIVFQVKIDEPWHIYSIHQNPDDGPMPTSIKFDKSNDYELIGKLKQSKGIKEIDKVFQVEVEYFSKKAEFWQEIKIKKNGKIKISGTYEYQACTEEKCIFPPPEPFETYIEANNITSALSSDNKDNHAQHLSTKDSSASSVLQSDSFLTKNNNTTNASHSNTSEKTTTNHTPNASELSGWMIFIEGFLGGLAALFTPCVFPLIPMNISFFTKRHKDRKKSIKESALYSISIIVIYLLLGIFVTLIFGASALNDLSTNVWFNLIFFVILLVFGFSFLGAFEINLPSSWVNKMDNLSNKGGYLGIFFMAFTLALVSFSCTGPIVGTLLVQTAASGEIIAPAIGMFGFSSALALPFGLFAAFPSWMKSLPKSDSWLNSVKVTLGFLEIALAFKFASNADLVIQAQILTREVFLVIWIALFALLTLYLLGFFKTHHDGEVKYLSVTRLMFATLSLSFTLYMLPGLWGAPLNLISGILPPLEYSESPHGFMNTSNPVIYSEKTNPLPDGADINKHGIIHFKNNYQLALDYAKKVNKPLMIDFTGHACANCRKTEDFIWPDERVKNILNNEVVLVSLYVDDKRDLPENEHFEAEWYGRKRKITTIGDKFKYMEETKYGQSTQPLYVLLDHQENLLTEVRGYNPDKEAYISWLKEGIKKFKEKK
ncbi:MAG: protein-disulfide reductase DsbD family protein [Bacteroidia bacterium]|nr:protein-disulfide reductase DsbD family protein [Bacteroidia bacterium]